MTVKSRLIMVRHGQTAANLGQVWHGTTDSPLTDVGRDQARRLGDYFHQVMEPHVIYASPLQRARHTAQALADRHGLEVLIDERLQEFSVGEWEGVTFDRIRFELDRDGRLFSDPDFTPPGGESHNIVRQRMTSALDEILSSHQHRNVVVVSHGMAMAMVFSHYLHGDTGRWIDYTKRNTAFSELCPVRKELLFFDRLDHLEEVAEPDKQA